MKKYALIKSGLVVNVIVAEEEFITPLITSGSIDEAIDLAEHPEFPVSIGNAFDGEDFSQFADLASAKAARLAEFQAEINTFVDARYDFRTRERFTSMMLGAMRQGLTNRALYIDGILNWSTSVGAYANTVIASIQSKLTVTEVMAVSWSIESSVPPDPKLKVAIALQITD